MLQGSSKALLLSGQVALSAINVVLVHRVKELHGGDYPFSAAAAVLAAEAAKLALSALLLLFYTEPSERSAAGLRDLINTHITPRGFAHFAIPAAVYCVENNLRFIVLRKLATPVTFVVFSHVEIPIVAVMSTMFLRRQFTHVQWVSILLLLNGVMASQMAVCESQQHAPCTHLSDYPALGLLLVVVGSTLAAAAGIVSEYLFQKDYAAPIYLQNIQLYLWGCVFNLLVVAVREPARVWDLAIFRGFDSYAMVIVLTMALSGLCVSAVVKFMSNVAKVYASACGIFITALLSAALSSFDISLPFLLAAMVVVCALYLYRMQPSLSLPGTPLQHSPMASFLDERTPKLKADKEYQLVVTE
eukprot:jgi/Chlat1/1552/Chrsp122S01813